LQTVGAANRFTGDGRKALVGIAPLLAQGASGQPPERFEVAVIRPTQSVTATGTSFNLFPGGRIRITNEVKLLIRVAFQMQDSQIAGGPKWLDTDRYDIEAKTGRPEKLKPDQVSPLVRDLLEDRFHLKFHRESREQTAYALVVARGGPKLKPKAEGAAPAMNTSGGQKSSRLTATATSMELLAGYVGNRLGRIVVDKTALTDAYDFTLEWAPDDAPDSSAPSLIAALRDQLELRLESQKSPVEVLVIDSIERPSEN
jgi:uncharacterized protein (TIGR03435 family)